MLRTFLKSKIHFATVTETALNYQGSLTVDADLMKAADMLPHEKVLVVNVNNGARFETYLIEGEPGSGAMCVNGAAARLAEPGDKIIVMTFCQLTDEEAARWQPRVVHVDEHNHPLG